MTGIEPRPIDRAWALVDEALYQAEGGGSRVSLDLSLPTDPAEVAHLVFSMVRIATEALQANGIDAGGEHDRERARVVTEAIRQVTSAEPDPVRGVTIDEARVADHYGPNGPVEAVYAFLRSVDESSFVEVWSWHDRDLRLVRAQAWLWNNREASELASQDLAALAQSWVDNEAIDDLWPSFASIELHSLRSSWSTWLDCLRSGSLGAGSASRLVGPDLEVVLLMPTEGEPLVFNEPTPVHSAITFVVRRTDDGWRIAAYGDRLPEPGWPPTIN